MTPITRTTARAVLRYFTAYRTHAADLDHNPTEAETLAMAKALRDVYGGAVDEDSFEDDADLWEIVS